MPKRSVYLQDKDIDGLPYRELQSICKQRSLPASRITAKAMQANLKRSMNEQAAESDATSPIAADNVVSGHDAPQSLSAAESSYDSANQTHAAHTYELSKGGEELKPLQLLDTATSPEKQPQMNNKLVVAAKTPLPSQQVSEFHERSPALGDVDHATMPTKLFSEPEPDNLQKQDQHALDPQPRRQWLHKQWPWLLCLLLLSALCWYMMQQGRGQGSWASVGPKCNQQMQFETLAPLLADSDARTHLADLWSGETSDPQKAAGVLLACADRNTSSAAAMAVATSMSPSCGHCLHHFDMPAWAAASGPAHSQELAGQAQKALVSLLRQCSHAVVIIEGIESTPPALLPVFINALSEHGHFEDSGKQVPAYRALIIATIVMPTGSLEQASEEHVAHRVKQHLVTALVNQGISDAVGNQASALRRRFEHVALLV